MLWCEWVRHTPTTMVTIDLTPVLIVTIDRAVYEIMWKNVVEPNRPRITIRRMRFACWVPKATNSHSGYVIMYNTYRISPATMVARTSLNVTLYVYWLSNKITVKHVSQIHLYFKMKITRYTYMYRFVLKDHQVFFSLLYLYHQSSTDYKYTYAGSTKWQYTTWLD
jgi:hypothetical protein